MKRLEIEGITSCYGCPYLAGALFSVMDRVPRAAVSYCGLKAQLNSRSTGVEMVRAVNEAIVVDPENIPDWCPLPNTD